MSYFKNQTFVDGGGITWSLNTSTNAYTATASLSGFTTANLTENTNLYFTNERAQDAIGSALTNSNSITFTYDDNANTITATVVIVEDLHPFFLGTVSDGSYKIVVNSSYGGTINEVTTISTAGTGTCTVKINTTALGGTANSVSTSEQTQAQSSANVFVAGDDIQITMSSTSSLANMSVKIKYTRVLT